MNARTLDLTTCTNIALFAVLLTVTGYEGTSARMLLLLPLIFLVPGYTLTAALFAQWSLDARERLLFAVGFSVAVTVFGGLLLHWVGAGLTISAWTLYLSGATLLLAVTAFARRVTTLRQHDIPELSFAD